MYLPSLLFMFNPSVYLYRPHAERVTMFQVASVYTSFVDLAIAWILSTTTGVRLLLARLASRTTLPPTSESTAMFMLQQLVDWSCIQHARNTERREP